MLHFRTWLLAAACFVLAPSVTAQAADGLPPVAPASSGDAAIVKRIFANWKARQERTKSLHVEWNTRVVRKVRRLSSLEGLRRGLWVEGDDRFRVEFSRLGGGKNMWDRMPRGQRTWNGTVNMILEWPQNPAAFPRGVVRRDTLRELLDDDLERTALLLVFRPWHVLTGLQASRFRVVTEHAIVDGVHCVKLERPLAGTVEHAWVDPIREDVPILFEKTLRGALWWRVAVQYRPSHDVGWVPESWTCQYQTETLVQQCTATKLSVNESFPPKTFQLDFPPGTLVFDEASHAPFLVAFDGSRAAPPPFDFVRSATFRRALGARVDFTIEPEPVGDVIGFVSQKFKVPIEIDKTAFRLAAIDPNFDVHCDVRGLTAMELLRWMAAQSPKPIALFEQDGKLVLKPLIGAKATPTANPPRSSLKNAP